MIHPWTKMLAHMSMHVGFPTFGVFEISYWKYLFDTFDCCDLYQRCSFCMNLVRDRKFILNILLGMQGHAWWRLHRRSLFFLNLISLYGTSYNMIFSQTRYYIVFFYVLNEGEHVFLRCHICHNSSSRHKYIWFENILSTTSIYSSATTRGIT